MPSREGTGQANGVLLHRPIVLPYVTFLSTIELLPRPKFGSVSFGAYLLPTIETSTGRGIGAPLIGR
jgi:hypothetical protein